MEKPNFNIVAAIFGQRGSGKTEYARGNPEYNLKGFFKPSLENGMKCLIVDTIDHPSYRDVPIIRPNQLEGWKRGVYRIIYDADEMAELNLKLNSLPSLWNTFILYEDAYKHQAKTLDKPLKRLIIDSKQKNINIAFMYHSFGMAPPDLYRFVDVIELFKVKDHPSCRKDNMPGYYEEALKQYTAVMADPNPFAHRTIKTEL